MPHAEEQRTEEENDQEDSAGGQLQSPIVKAAFGAKNRNRLIDRFLVDHPGDPPWKAAYKLILWVDKTIGLAHCYESDKCQPGGNWHRRALRFHDWLATALGTTPAEVGDQIDWLFKHVSDDYANFLVSDLQRTAARALAQRAPYEGRGFPEPGDDPEMVDLIKQVFGSHLEEEPTQEQWRELTKRIRQYVALENKRKNIVGEGFEDVLSALIRRSGQGALTIHARKPLDELEGFTVVRRGRKRTKVDLAIVRQDSQPRTLVTAKWSVRADREEQFGADLDKYIAASDDDRPFQYVLVTNEFDPARLKRACEAPHGRALMFTSVVHICPDALRAVYGEDPEGTMREVVNHIDAGRLIGLDTWIAGLR